MLVCLRMRKVNWPSAWLPYLVTYVQNEAPVLSSVHLTGCFLCRKEEHQPAWEEVFTAKAYFFCMTVFRDGKEETWEFCRSNKATVILQKKKKRITVVNGPWESSFHDHVWYWEIKTTRLLCSSTHKHKHDEIQRADNIWEVPHQHYRTTVNTI